MVTVGDGREHELVSGGGESFASVFVLKVVVSSVKENLLACHVVAIEKGGKDVECGEGEGCRSSWRREKSWACYHESRSSGGSFGCTARCVASVRGENTGSGVPRARVLEELTRTTTTARARASRD